MQLANGFIYRYVENLYEVVNDETLKFSAQVNYAIQKNLRNLLTIYQELEQERKKWKDTNNELVNMLASELLKHNEPITVLTMMIRNESLAMYSNQKLSGLLNCYSKECGFKKTIIDGEEYWSL